MGTRTINGKSLQEVVEALKRPFSPDEFKQNLYDYYYLPTEKFRQRLDETVGIFNYDFLTSEPRVSMIGTRPHISLSGSITIRDDEGNSVVTKSSCGGSQVIFSNKADEAVSFKNDLDSATADVFKRCCKRLGIAEAQLKQLRGTDKNNSKKQDVNPAETIKLFRITLDEAFSSIGKDGYGAMVHIEGEKDARKLIIWKAAQEKIERYIPIDKFLQYYTAGKEFSVYGYESVFKPRSGKEQLQLIMDAPFHNEEGD